MDRSASSVFRAILPAPSGGDTPISGPSSESGASAGAGTSVGGAAGGSAGAGGLPPSKRRRHVPAACASCRRRKIKCSAERPKCSQCQRLSVDCVYDTVGTETLSEARHRRLGELQSRSTHYEELFNIIKTRPDPDVAAIVARIRQGAHVDDIVRFVKEGDILIQLSVAPDTHITYTFPFSPRMPAVLFANPSIPYMNSLLARGAMDNPGESSSFPPPSLAHSPGTVGQLDIDLNTWNMYQTPYHSVELVDPRIGSVKASRWTTVTSDNTVVQKLLQIYFIFDFPFYTFFHKDHLLKDMAEGRERYCSSLLVNVILAQACRGHQGLPQRFNFWESQNLRNRFLAEVRRLWDLEAGQTRITTIQAAAIMTLVSSIDTLDLVGSRYLGEAIAMAKSMGLFDSYAAIQSRRRRQVYTVTAWGLYGLQGVIAFHYRRATTQDTPPKEPLPSYMDASTVFGDLFVRYPRSHTPLSCQHGEVARAAAEFRMVMVDIARRSYGSQATAISNDDGEFRLKDALHYHERLQSWYQNLPRTLTAYHIVLPAQLSLHLHYHNVLINIFMGLTTSEQTAASLAQIRLTQDCPSPAEVIALSKACIEALVRLYYLRHGFGGFDSTFCQFQWLMGETAVQALTSTTSNDGSLSATSDSTSNNNAFSRDELLSSLILCAIGLRESGRFSFIAQGLLQVLKSHLAPRETAVLGRFLAEGVGYDGDGQDASGLGDMSDMREKAERYNQSNLPINLFSMRLEPEQTLKKSLLSSSSSPVAAAHAEEKEEDREDSLSTAGGGGSKDDDSMTSDSN